MYMMQKDLLSGMDKDFVRQFMDFAVKESHRKGYVLFREGKRANHFFILLKGCVKISIGETGHTVYTVNHPGEAFGWSSLLGRRGYSATAECKESTKLLKIDAAKLHELLEREPAFGRLFFKRIAGILGNRLLQTYKMIAGSSEAEVWTSFGTGQVIDTESTTA
jgi:CRP-like cAMP-binding protein